MCAGWVMDRMIGPRRATSRVESQVRSSPWITSGSRSARRRLRHGIQPASAAERSLPSVSMIAIRRSASSSLQAHADRRARLGRVAAAPRRRARAQPTSAPGQPSGLSNAARRSSAVGAPLDGPVAVAPQLPVTRVQRKKSAPGVGRVSTRREELHHLGDQRHRAACGPTSSARKPRRRPLISVAARSHRGDDFAARAFSGASHGSSRTLPRPRPKLAPGAAARHRSPDRHRRPRPQRGGRRSSAASAACTASCPTEFPFSWRDRRRRQRAARTRRPRSPARLAARAARRRATCASSARAAAARCARPGRRAGRGSSATWTSTSRPTCARCCRSSRRCSRATPTSRSARGSPTARASCAAPKRELISRAYNRLLHATLRARFSDAQCGFKAVRRDALDGAARRTSATTAGSSTPSCSCSPSAAGCGSTRCPVDWIDDPDSRVRHRAHRASTTCAAIARLLAASPVARFAAVGVLSTLAYALLFLAAARAARRRRRERARARAHRGRQHGRQPPAHVRRARPRRPRCASTCSAPLVFLLTLGLDERRAASSCTGSSPSPPRAVELAVLVVAEHRGDRHPLRRAPQLGLRPPPRVRRRRRPRSRPRRSLTAPMSTIATAARRGRLAAPARACAGAGRPGARWPCSRSPPRLCLWDLTSAATRTSTTPPPRKAGERELEGAGSSARSIPGSFITVDKPPLSLWLHGPVGARARLLVVQHPAAAGALHDRRGRRCSTRPCGACSARPPALLAARRAGAHAGDRRDRRASTTPTRCSCCCSSPPPTCSCGRSSRAARSTSRWCGAVVGLAFMTKMLQGWMVVPALARRVPARRPAAARSSGCASSRVAGRGDGRRRAPRGRSRSRSGPGATPYIGGSDGRLGVEPDPRLQRPRPHLRRGRRRWRRWRRRLRRRRRASGGCSTSRSAARSPGCCRSPRSSLVAGLWLTRARAADRPAPRRLGPVRRLGARPRRRLLASSRASSTPTT